VFKMAGQSLVEFISGLLLGVMPSPELWGFLLLIVFIVYMTIKKFPMSVSGFIAMILVISMVEITGDAFGVLKSILWAVSGATFFLGLWNVIGKR